MSNISIQGAATGTGVFTIASPATNTDRTLTLPDEAGTVLTTAGVPASAMPAGSVLQVVSAGFTSSTSTSSTSYVPTTVTASITPTSSTSKIYILVSCGCCIQAANTEVRLTVYRNGAGMGAGDLGTIYSATHSGFFCGHIAFNYLDSPTTTSSTTYTVYMKEGGVPGTVNTNGDVKTITLMEIAA